MFWPQKLHTQNNLGTRTQSEQGDSLKKDQDKKFNYHSSTVIIQICFYVFFPVHYVVCIIYTQRCYISFM